jgi:hypothetical protein
LTFLAYIIIDNSELACKVQVDFQGQERLLGRDVLNKLNVLFRGPAGELVINP